MEIVLDVVNHVYRNTITDQKYTSVTNFIGQYKQTFDKDKWSQHVADRDGVDKSVILDTWKQLTKDAQDKGTNAHTAMELYVKNKHREPGYDELLDSFDEKTKSIIKPSSQVLSETIVYNHQHMLAGTADLFVVNGDVFHVLDYKTNKKFNFFSKYSEYFKEPIEYLQQCEFTTYSIQMSVYAHLFELMTGKRCASIRVLYLREFADKRFWQDIHCTYLKSAVKELMQNRLITLEQETV